MSATCFGKIPSRGDFVKGTGQHQLIEVLDRWMSAGMELLSTDPTWKIAYDQAPTFDFAFVGARNRVSVIGHLRPSQDASGRRFPFIAAATIERDDSLMFRCGPAALLHPLGELGKAAERATGGADMGEVMQAVDTLDCTATVDKALREDPLGHYVRRTTLADFASSLSPAQSPEAVRRIILAVGILLRPVLGNPALAIEKGLSMPLPYATKQRYLAAGLWLYLVTALLRKTAIEIQALISHDARSPRLTIGFNGASAHTLLCALSPALAAETTVALDDPEWIDEHPDLTHDYGVAKLASYLAQPSLTLEAALNTFREVFLGE
ncbi:MAG TPA: type VI secretion system-associated protein TagF [Aromatoleum sp.]|uniref:type VI secretion system-associated protein TagF n=1 Tax=Aromatoleum sp. TaxID=2307007 RepID=UPI002B4A8647|nr:type VI secretion system-associated protein TagF [Aromatoleum sp.]HJV27444.1 type VI secretion system-associated protein TagF [Aromatoleum sp.]